MEEAAGRINGGKVSAEELYRRHGGICAESLDISKFSNTFQTGWPAEDSVTRSRDYWCTSGFWKGAG